MAVLGRPDALRPRRAEAAMAGAAAVRDALAAGRAADLPSTGGVSAVRADELIADVRAGRDRS